MYSRRLKVEEKDNKRKAFGFILLTIAAVSFMFFFGLPLLVKLANFTYDLRKSSEPIGESDTTPPPPPRLNGFPLYTKEDKLDLRGNTEPGANVLIHLNNNKIEVLANSEGDFSQKLTLSKGENSLYVQAKDAAGNESLETQNFKITLDNEPPEIEILSPKNGSEYYGSRSRQLTIEGVSEKDSKVQINDRLTIVSSDGKFTFLTSLSSGENKFLIKSEDLAGNLTETEISVTYYP